jgi:hypothetical protein
MFSPRRHEGQEGFGQFELQLRDLRVLRGKQNKLNATHAPDKSLNPKILAEAKGNRLARRSQSVFRRSAAGL